MAVFGAVAQLDHNRQAQADPGKYWVTKRLPQIYTENQATFPLRIRKITVQISGNFWVTQYSSRIGRVAHENLI